MSYEPTENFDALLSLGVTAVTAEALDCLMQDGYVEELSGPILGKFAAMDEAGALECIEKIKSTGAKNISVRKKLTQNQLLIVYAKYVPNDFFQTKSDD